MSKRIEWTDDARAAVYVQWIANEKNIQRTAKDVGMGTSTLAYWVKG